MKKFVLAFFLVLFTPVVGQEMFVSIEEALKQPEQVRYLRLKRKKLKEVPKEILLFPNLEKLDLSNNKLEELPVFLSQLQSLKEIILSRNQFEAFPEVLTKMPHLEKIDLWDNYIEDVAEGVENIGQLKELELRGVQMPQARIDSIQDLLKGVKVYLSDPCDCVYK